MSCYFPWFKEGDVLKRPLNCNKCIGCKLARASDWASRVMCEASLYRENAFVLLTYKDAPFSLEHFDFQCFMKRLRFHYSDRKIRYFMCGEYGTPSPANGFVYRPHFHSILFNWWPEDAKFFKYSDSGHKLYRSVILEKLWPLGHATVGRVSFDSAAYVAKYCVKKYTCAGTEDMYEDINLDTGEVKLRVPEYGRMSLKPGIGAEWFRRYKSDVYPDGKMVVEGRELPAPKYFDKLYRRQGVGDAMLLSLRRREKAVNGFSESYPDRLRAREAVVRAKLNQFK